MKIKEFVENFNEIEVASGIKRTAFIKDFGVSTEESFVGTKRTKFRENIVLILWRGQHNENQLWDYRDGPAGLGAGLFTEEFSQSSMVKHQ